MEDFIGPVLDWIGRNENILSGLGALAALAALTYTGFRNLRRHIEKRRSNFATSVEPQEIRYCRTTDGKRVAYAITGEGPPMIRALGWFTNLEYEWESPLGRSFWQGLSKYHTLVRYDGRGMGLSEKTLDFSSDTRLADLEAVVDAADFERFVLTGTSEGCSTAIRYAAKYPERVSHLILFGAAVMDPNAANSPPYMEHRKRSKAYYAMIESGWGKASHYKLFADLFLGERASDEEIAYFVELQRSSATLETAVAYYQSMVGTDSGFLAASDVRAQTLLMHNEDDQMVPFQNSVNLASEIPGAVLKPWQGDCHFLMLKSSAGDEYIASIERFLSESGKQPIS